MHAPSRRIPYRSWPGALAVLLAIGAYVGGLTFWDRHTPGSRALVAGKAITLGPARFIPAPGWEMDVSRSRAGKSLVLFKGSHTFVVTTGPWVGGPDGPMLRQQRLMERGQGLRIDGEVSAFVNDWGMQGKTFAYDGATLAGRFWQVVDLQRRTLLQVNVYGAHDGQNEAMVDARGMLASMDLGAPL